MRDLVNEFTYVMNGFFFFKWNDNQFQATSWSLIQLTTWLYLVSVDNNEVQIAYTLFTLKILSCSVVVWSEIVQKVNSTANTIQECS